MDITFLELLLFGLASFRFTRLMVYDKITAFIRNAFITEVEETDENGEKAIYLVPKNGVFKGFIGELLSCYWCTGIWSSIILYVLYATLPVIAVPIIVVFAISGIAAIIETLLQNWL
jgi:Protein of unknown function (DUF1360)